MTALSKEYRIEKDSMGLVRVPKKVYYGAQTQRAVENFPISEAWGQASVIGYRRGFLCG